MNAIEYFGSFEAYMNAWRGYAQHALTRIGGNLSTGRAGKLASDMADEMIEREVAQYNHIMVESELQE